MKFLFVTLTALFSLLNSKSYADDVKVNSAVIKSFQSSFKNASEVKWSFTETLYKANFSFNGQYVAAYYDVYGEMVAVTRNISSNQLPVTLQTVLKNDYKDLWVTDLFEVSDETGTTYYITLEDADTKLVLRSTGSLAWSVYQKQGKS